MLSATPDDGSVGEGKWTQWVFDVAPVAGGNQVVTMYAIGDDGNALASLTSTVVGGVSEIFLYGSRFDSLGLPLAGIYVDDVKWVAAPEPATMALLGAGGLLALLRRRRSK